MQPPVVATLGKYQLVRKLATGGMAEVYLARVAGPGGFEKTLVLKRVLPHLAEDETFISMFRSEAKLAAQLNHPNVVSIFDFGQEAGSWYLVMEYIDGPNLRALFRRAFELGTPIPFNLAAKIVSAACEGLAYAHDFVDPETGQPLELVHRDVSPDNILLGRNGGVKVVDFGIAKAAGQSHHTKTGTIKGKFAYMPPEQLRAQPLDRRTDVFALGIVLYELLTGSKPFDNSTDATIMQAILFEPFWPASQKRPDTPPELQRILDRALAKDRAARYPDCRALQVDLDRFIVSQGVPAGQHELAKLVASLANAQAGAMATPSAKLSQANLPQPASELNPTTPLGARPRAGDSLRTEPLMPTPAPVERAPSAVPAEAPLVLPRNNSARVAGALVAVLALGAGGGVWWASRTPEPEPLPPPVVARPVEAPSVRTAPDPAPVIPAPTPTPAVTPPPPRQVATPVHPVHLPTRPAPPKTVEPPHEPTRAEVRAEIRPSAPAAVEAGLVDFRVRPYASVFVNGTFYGVTPFARVKLNVGTYTVKLVNKDIGKEITLQYEVKAGDNTLKYNLETE